MVGELSKKAISKILSRSGIALTIAGTLVTAIATKMVNRETLEELVTEALKNKGA